MPPNCTSNNNGTLSVSASGGSGTYLYSLNNGLFQNTATFNNLSANTYHIKVKDAKSGCSAQQDYPLFQIAPNIADIKIKNTLCGLSNGEVSVVANGGVPPYSYSIDSLANLFQDNNSFIKLPAGKYTITIKDKNDCKHHDTLSIAPSTSVKITSITPTATTCAQNNGSLSIIATSGTKPYQYAIDTTNNFQQQNAFANLKSGDYVVSVIDSNHCIAEQKTTIAGSDGPQITKITTKPVSCNEIDGQIDVQATGGVTPISYILNDNLTQNTPIFDKLKINTYEISVKDSKGCMVKNKVNVLSGCPEILYLPNAIAPLGKNSSFKIDFQEPTLQISSFSIIDRWGMTIYSKNNFTVNSNDILWDGKYENELVETGVYAYKISVIFASNNERTFTGKITVIK